MLENTYTTNQGVQRLRCLLDSLVESFTRRVAPLAEHLVLCEEHAVDTAHQATPLTVKVRVDLLFKSGLVEVSGTDSNAERDSLLLSLAGHVLENGDGAVDAAALLKERTHGTAGALGRDEDNVNVGRDFDLGEVLEDGGEAVREVEGLFRVEQGLSVT